MKRSFSRRDFLKLMGTMAGAGMVSACVPQALTTTPQLPAISSPSTSPNPAVCATPTPTPIPSPTRISTNLDVCAYYTQFRDYPGGLGALDRSAPGYEMVVPLYGDHQDPLTMKIDIKWAMENGIGTFVMPFGRKFEESVGDQRARDWFLPASEPPFDINFALMFNPEFESLNTSDPSQAGTIETRARDSIEFLVTSIKHPRYKRLADGRPVVFYFLAQVVAYFFGVDKLEQTVNLLRRNLNEDIFLVGDVMYEPDVAQNDPDPKHHGDYILRQIQAFDAITSYYILRAGYEWHSDYEYHHVVTPFSDMIKGYKEAFDFWGDKAHKHGVKLVPAPTPTGFSNRLLYEGGLDTDLIDRHDGVSYETAKEMAELGAKYADPDLKMVMMACWNELSEGAAVVPSVVYKFNPAHAVRDTFAIQPAGGWPKDYYPPS